MNEVRTDDAAGGIDDAFTSSQPRPPGGGLGSHRSNSPRSGATHPIDVTPCHGAFQVQKADAARAPVRHHRFATAEDAAGRLIATGQGDSFEILQVVARVTRHPRNGA